MTSRQVVQVLPNKETDPFYGCKKMWTGIIAASKYQIGYLNTSLRIYGDSILLTQFAYNN